jgi:hypothetical protein
MKKMDEKEAQLAILIDYEVAYFNNGRNDFANLIDALYNEYIVIIIYALPANKDTKKRIEEELKNNNIKFDKVLCAKKTLESESETKLALYKSIEDKCSVRFLIDSNKKAIKTFQKLGIQCLRFKKSLSKDTESR